MRADIDPDYYSDENHGYWLLSEDWEKSDEEIIESNLSRVANTLDKIQGVEGEELLHTLCELRTYVGRAARAMWRRFQDQDIPF